MQDIKAHIDSLFKEIKNTEEGQRKPLFISYVKEIIRIGNENIWLPETCGYEIMGCIRFDDLSSDPELEPIFDIACDLEKVREISYVMPDTPWDAKTADQLKMKEWRMLVKVVEKMDK